MSDLLTHIRRFELVDVDLDKEPQCEGSAHGTRQFGHDDGPARFTVRFPCDGRSILACAGRATHFAKVGAACPAAGCVHAGYELLITEL